MYNGPEVMYKKGGLERNKKDYIVPCHSLAVLPQTVLFVYKNTTAWVIGKKHLRRRFNPVTITMNGQIRITAFSLEEII